MKESKILLKEYGMLLRLVGLLNLTNIIISAFKGENPTKEIFVSKNPKAKQKLNCTKLN